MYLASIYVTLKPTVNDPQGLTIMGALRNMGLNSVTGVRMGKYLEVTVDEDDFQKASNQVEQMCDKLLANPVIEEYRFELKGPEPP